jgi:hypothetical protein
MVEADPNGGNWRSGRRVWGRDGGWLVVAGGGLLRGMARRDRVGGVVMSGNPHKAAPFFVPGPPPAPSFYSNHARNLTPEMFERAIAAFRKVAAGLDALALSAAWTVEVLGRKAPPRLNGVRLRFDPRGSWGWRWHAYEAEPVRVRTCRGRRR